MGWLFNRKKAAAPDQDNLPVDFSFLGTDMHSHFVPGVDDGSPSDEESIALIRGMKDLGYSKLITTPHVHVEFYNNEISALRRQFDHLQRTVEDMRLGVSVALAAEYMLDEFFL